MGHFVLDFHRRGLAPASVIHDRMDWGAGQVVPLLD